MMLKILAIFVILGAVAIEATPARNQVISGYATSQNPNHTGQSSVPPVAPITNNQAITYYQQQSTDKPQGWHRLVAWPDGITAWLIMLTLGAIVWQSYATARSADAAFLQIQMMKDKERARIKIKTLSSEVTRVGEEFWHIKTTIELRNVGTGRAYVRLGTGNIVMMGNEMPADPYLKSLDVVDGFIDPTSPVTESFYFFPPDDASLSDYSQRIWSGQLQPRITGFIEYETVGTRFHRNFSYVWIGNGSPLNVGRLLTAADDFSPETDEEKISFGYWLPNSMWLTGWAGDNEEYEMEPEKKAKKSRQN